MQGGPPTEHTSTDVVGRLRAGEQVLACWTSLGSASVAEIVAAVGFDAVLLDLEHGEFGPASLPDLLRAVEVGGAAPLVRVRELGQVGAALDAGAVGVLVPDIRSAAMAADVVAAACYPPEGERGAAPMVRATRYGLRAFADHLAAARPIVGVQVEGPDGIEQLDDILGVAGVDLVFVGPFDLSQHLGVAGDTTHERVVRTVADIVARARSAGVATGVWAPDADAAAVWLDAGVSLVSVANATSLLAAAGRSLVQELRRSTTERTSERSFE